MTYSQIRTLFYQLTGTNSSQLGDSVLNLYTQPAEDRVVQLILQYDDQWQHDDSNRTTLPIGTQNIVSGQQDYQLPTTILTLDRVELLPNGANTTTGWTRLTQIDQQFKKFGQSQSLTSYQSTSGQPLEYDIVGMSVFLYPKPNYSQANSLKFFYSRIPLKYDYTTSLFTDGTGSGPTTDTPGFNPLFHELIAWRAASQYSLQKARANTNGLLLQVDKLEKDLCAFYGQRNRDGQRGFTVSNDSNR